MLVPVGALFIDGLEPVADQDQAVRFFDLHLIDKVYDLQVGLAFSATCPLPGICKPAFRDRGYAKMQWRCISRLHELIGETAGVLVLKLGS